MRMTTINDLWTRYNDLCGHEEPVLTREALDLDYRDWCRAHGRVDLDNRGYVSDAHTDAVHTRSTHMHVPAHLRPARDDGRHPRLRVARCR